MPVRIVATYMVVPVVLFYGVLAQEELQAHHGGHGGNKEVLPQAEPEVEKEPPSNTEEIEDTKTPRDQHTFVALLDLVFTDQSKRTCTGAIIHDYVVVTAAHCFVKEYTNPELTVSFVVIGTKKMFDTGYEQYLPIERYKIHPKFKGWTADLALVYTFAAMTADKPGKILPLAGEKVINPVDTSITVLSWGKSSERHLFQQEHQTQMTERENAILYLLDVDRKTEQGPTTTTRAHHGQYDDEVSIEQGIHVTQLRSATISSKRDDQELYATVRIKSINRRANIAANEKVFPRNRVKPYFTNWRRKMGNQQNNMTVEVFHFANMQMCKKIVEQAMPSIYVINAEGNDVVCYTSDDYFIAIEDSGAPAIRYGRLFAITVGGVESDGEHVAIGMRISCYCSWIAANLPSGGNMMDCCQNCCELVHKPATSSGRSGPKTYRGFFDDRVA